MLEVLKLNAEWLQELLKLEELKTFAVLHGCLKLGLFEFLEKPRSAEEISKKVKLNYRAAEAVCRFLSSKGLLIEEGGKYRISEISKVFLSRRSPFSIAEVFEEKREEIEFWLNLENTMKGENLRREADFFKRRIRVLGKIALLKDLKFVFKIASLEEFRKAKRLLDLGGGHGLYAYAFTLLNEELIADVFDLPEVVNSAKDFLKPFNAQRVNFVEGDFFRDELGENYDIVFSSFNPGGKRAELIPKISRALKKGGIYVNRQYFPADGFGIEDLEWNLWGFERLKKGSKAYTFEGDLGLGEYISKLEDNGFKVFEVFSKGYTAILARKL